ncbi:NAD(P)-binding protein [Serendipita vermifera]|nr:NAD(P)-binding protein [Serendipita vermifera]
MPQTVSVCSAQVIIAALNRDYQVVATVQAEEKAKQTTSTLQRKVGNKISNLSFAIVPVVEADGAFDDVLKAHDFDAVIHTATPSISKRYKDPNEIVSPAIGGTKSILKSIKNLGPNVKRVVITSSFASVIDSTQGLRPNYAYTEKDWNPDATVSGDPIYAYYGAKTWAEKAAWDFLKEEKPKFELVTICPPMIFGQVAQYIESADQLNTSSASLYAVFSGQQKEIQSQDVMIFANVIDVGTAHILAVDAANAGNKQFLICADKPYNNKQISDAFIKHFPEFAPNVPTKLQEGVDAEGYPAGGYYTGDNSLSKKILGISYQDIEQTMVQFADSVKTLPRSS